ncbi:MAG: sulfotransferase, partial [Pseudomonadota bacterium]
MKFLVCGVHRSGNSVTAHWLQTALGQPILDDPLWAITAEDGFLKYRTCKHARQQIDAHSIVKCPRAITYIPEVLSDYPDTIFVIPYREPRSV